MFWNWTFDKLATFGHIDLYVFFSKIKWIIFLIGRSMRIPHFMLVMDGLPLADTEVLLNALKEKLLTVIFSGKSSNI
jgi:hypothetical protein